VLSLPSEILDRREKNGECLKNVIITFNSSRQTKVKKIIDLFTNLSPVTISNSINYVCVFAGNNLIFEEEYCNNKFPTDI